MKSRSTLLLALLSANEQLGTDNISRVVLVKQVFLAENIRPLYMLWNQMFSFVRYRYGPYTDDIFYRLDTLLFNGLVEITTGRVHGGRQFARYRITASGKRILQGLEADEIKQLSLDIVWSLQTLGIVNAKTICKLVYREAEFARIFADHARDQIRAETRVPLPSITTAGNQSFITLAVLLEIQKTFAERQLKFTPRDAVRTYLETLLPRPAISRGGF
jgi:DNA-binding PadR family transcriptional regulator